MHFPLLQDLLIILGFSVFVVFLLQKLKLPSILGFLVTGILIGPHGLGLVAESEQIEIISEIGVILLLFVIGLELSLKNLMLLKKSVFIGGSFQVFITVAVVALVYNFFGNTWQEAIFVGFLFSLSSTAIVLKVLQDRRVIGAPHGKNALAILIFQDIIVVPMMLVTPIMAGEGGDLTYSILSLLIKSLVVVIITYISAKYVVPRLMYLIAKTKSKELFLITTITICFTIAFITSEAGLSLALGAFIAGLIISESDYSHQSTSMILPFRELFTSFFFVSVGMLLNLEFFLENILVIPGILIIVFLLKSIIAASAIAILKYPPRTFLLTGLSLFQVGEFAFILSKVGIKHNLLTVEINQYFLAVSIISMFFTPFIIIFSENITLKLMNFSPLKSFDKKINDKKNKSDIKPEDKKLNNHLVIIGYGINGSNLAKAARFSNIPYIVVELNAETVKKEQANGIPIIFGDASQEHILEHVSLESARVLVVAISDPLATRLIIKNVKSISPTISIIVRTRYVNEIEELFALGADDVIPEEFETSIEIFSRALAKFMVPQADIEYVIDFTRANNYGLFSDLNNVPRNLRPTNLPDFNISCVTIDDNYKELVGKELKELNLIKRYEINLLGINRKEEIKSPVKPEEKILIGDLLYVSGKQQNIDLFRDSLIKS